MIKAFCCDTLDTPQAYISIKKISHKNWAMEIQELGPKSPFGGPRSDIEVRWGAQAHDMVASYPGTLCESILDVIWPILAIPGAQRGPKGPPKMTIFTFWPFWPPKGPQGQLLWKHKSYLRYQDSLWRINWDIIFFHLASRKLATWADMGPPTDNQWAPRAISGPLFPSYMTLQ